MHKQASSTIFGSAPLKYLEIETFLLILFRVLLVDYNNLGSFGSWEYDRNVIDDMGLEEMQKE
jgi:hypothetical protein